MAFNPIDADTLARWTFEEKTLGGVFTNYPTGSPVDRVYSPVFGDASGNGHTLDFASTSFSASNTDSFRLGVPGLFGKRALALTGGPNTKDRDFARGAASIEPAGAWNASCWCYPYTMGDGLAVLFGKDFAVSDNNP